MVTGHIHFFCKLTQQQQQQHPSIGILTVGTVPTSQLAIQHGYQSVNAGWRFIISKITELHTKSFLSITFCCALMHLLGVFGLHTGL